MRVSKLLALFLFAVFIASIDPQSISTADATSHIGQEATVCGKVASERTATSSKGAPTFINLDAPYPKQIFTILIWGEDRPDVGTLPSEGSWACATGMIQDYRGTPEIVASNGTQLSRAQRGKSPGTPIGATARCRDGSYSFSQHHQGTCSYHGGVAEWLR